MAMQTHGASGNDHAHEFAIDRRRAEFVDADVERSFLDAIAGSEIKDSVPPTCSVVSAERNSPSCCRKPMFRVPVCWPNACDEPLPMPASTVPREG
jgi:hypothetical protein